MDVNSESTELMINLLVSPVWECFNCNTNCYYFHTFNGCRGLFVGLWLLDSVALKDQHSLFLLGEQESFQPKSQRTCSHVDNVLPLDLEITMLSHSTGRDLIFPQLTPCPLEQVTCFGEEITLEGSYHKPLSNDVKKWHVFSLSEW